MLRIGRFSYAELLYAELFCGGLMLIEIVGQVICERCNGGTPRRAHHMAEQYGLLTVITLGEGRRFGMRTIHF
jgi:low temperature requirement protein LtrA